MQVHSIVLHDNALHIGVDPDTGKQTLDSLHSPALFEVVLFPVHYYLFWILSP